MIGTFKGPYRWLSNFHLCTIVYEGIEYPSTEHAFQAAKSTNSAVRRWICESPTPSVAKARGKELDLRPDWEEIKIDVMREITRIKFQHADLRERLLMTGQQELVEGNTWGDNFWGVCRGVGHNHLGKILMEVRAEIRREESR